MSKTEDVALELLKRLVNEVSSEYASRSGNIYCVFCDESVEYVPHAGDCIYIEATKLVGRS